MRPISAHLQECFWAFVQTHGEHLRNSLDTTVSYLSGDNTHACFREYPHSLTLSRQSASNAFGVTFGASKVGNLD